MFRVLYLRSRFDLKSEAYRYIGIYQHVLWGIIHVKPPYTVPTICAKPAFPPAMSNLVCRAQTLNNYVRTNNLMVTTGLKGCIWQCLTICGRLFILTLRVACVYSQFALTWYCANTIGPWMRANGLSCYYAIKLLVETKLFCQLLPIWAPLATLLYILTPMYT